MDELFAIRIKEYELTVTHIFQIESPMHAPTKLVLPSGETQEFPLPESTFDFNFTNSVGFTYEATCVRNCLKKGMCVVEVYIL